MKPKQTKSVVEKPTASKLLDGGAYSPKIPDLDLDAVPEEQVMESMLDRPKAVDKNECFLCHGLGHWARECTSLPKVYLGNNPPICYYCGGEGHFARVCPSTCKFRPVKYSLPMISESELELPKRLDLRHCAPPDKPTDRTMHAPRHRKPFESMPPLSLSPTLPASISAFGEALHHSAYTIYDVDPYAYLHPYQAASFQPYYLAMYNYGVPYPVSATADYYDPQTHTPCRSAPIVADSSAATNASCAYPEPAPDKRIDGDSSVETLGMKTATLIGD